MVKDEQTQSPFRGANMLAVFYRQGGALLVACFISKLKPRDNLVLEARTPYPDLFVDLSGRAIVAFHKTSTAVI